jgi:hypothetical protein
MSNPRHLSPFTWLLLGLAIGLAAMYFYQLNTRDQYAREKSAASLDYHLNRQVFDSYHAESQPLAIAALSNYLANAERLKNTGHSFYATSESEPHDMMQAHAMLSRLYADSSQTNLSAQELQLALDCARATGRFPSVTNQSALWNFIGPPYAKASP